MGRSEHSWCHEPGTDVKRTIELDYLVADGFVMALMSVVEGVYRPVHVPLISLNLGRALVSELWHSASATCALDLYFSIRSLIHARFQLPLQFSA